jgi:hypothetical protein
MSLEFPTPEITDEVLLEFAKEVGSSGAVAVAGAKTRWDVGGALAEGTREVTAPSGIVDYRPEEMTVRVLAGTEVAMLDRTLRRAGQQTALPKRSGTVGGAIAVGENALRTLGRGRIRNCLLQVKYVSAEGQLITGGGTTVKNVSGFDVPRLMVGSLGTLGLFGEVLLRTNPVPEVSLLVRAGDADPFEILNSVLKPNMVLWDGHVTWVELIGNQDAVEAEANKLANLASFSETVILPRLPTHRWSLKPSEIRDIARYHDTGDFVASVGLGTVFGTKPQPERKMDSGIALISERMKAQFDPTGRLNPGRTPGVL